MLSIDDILDLIEGALQGEDVKPLYECKPKGDRRDYIAYYQGESGISREFEITDWGRIRIIVVEVDE